MRTICGTILAAAGLSLCCHGARAMQTIHCGKLPAGKQGAIDVSVGRQLFVDDLLVESIDGVARYWNHPVKIENPLVFPESGAAPKMVDGSSGAKDGEAVNLTCATDGGLWWDPTRQKFRSW